MDGGTGPAPAIASFSSSGAAEPSVMFAGYDVPESATKRQNPEIANEIDAKIRERLLPKTASADVEAISPDVELKQA